MFVPGLHLWQVPSVLFLLGSGRVVPSQFLQVSVMCTVKAVGEIECYFATLPNIPNTNLEMSLSVSCLSSHLAQSFASKKDLPKRCRSYLSPPKNTTKCAPDD